MGRFNFIKTELDGIRFIEQRIKKFLNRKSAPFVVTTILILIFHFGLLSSGKMNDDVSFTNMISKFHGIWDFTISRYQTWSSRFIIEAIIVILVRLPFLVWCILDSLVLILAMYSVNKLFGGAQRDRWMLSALILIFPLSLIKSAGFIATSLNYTWPLVLGLFSIIPIKKLLERERIKFYEYILFSLSLLFACNQEQMCVILFLVYLVFFVYYLVDFKKIDYFLLSQLILACCSLIFILTCPGNALRKYKEVGKWFPEYPNIPRIRKIEMGYSSSIYEFLMKSNIVFFVFALLLFLCVYLKYNNKIYKIISAIPLVCNVIFGLFSNVFSQVFPFINEVRKSLGKLGTNPNLNSVKSFIPDIIITIAMISVIVSVCLVFENYKLKLLNIFILGLGFISRMIMAFSPTIWASDDRTFTFMYFSFIICSVLLFREIVSKTDSKYSQYILNFCGSLAIFSYVNQFYLLVK